MTEPAGIGTLRESFETREMLADGFEAFGGVDGLDDLANDL